MGLKRRVASLETRLLMREMHWLDLEIEKWATLWSFARGSCRDGIGESDLDAARSFILFCKSSDIEPTFMALHKLP